MRRDHRLLGWLVRHTVAVSVVGRHVGAKQRSPVRPLLTSVVAGALWPLMLLGVLEFAVFAAGERAAH